MSVRSSVFASDLSMRESGGGRRAFAGWLHTIAYALWLGGLLSIGALIAPLTAHVIQTSPEFSSNVTAQQAILIGIIGTSFRIFNDICYGLGGVMIICDLMQAASAESTYGMFTWTRLFITVVLLASTFFLGLYLFPHMDASRLHGNMVNFNRLHKLYVLISEIQLVPLLIIPALTARRDQVVDSLY